MLNAATSKNNALPSLIPVEKPMTNPSPIQFITAPGNVPLTPGTRPKAIILADFNGDKALDILLGNGESQPNGTVSVYLNDRSGGFAAPTSFQVNGFEPEVAAAGDFNNDGFADIVTANEATPGSVSVLLGNGNGSFSAAPLKLSVGDEPHSVVVADVNKDGRADLITTNVVSNSVSVLLGAGNGTFAAAKSFATGNGAIAATTGDFNNDGKLDIATANVNANSVSILIGDGLGGFSVPTNVTVGDMPYGVVSGDFNGDGKLDFAAANTNNVSVVLGNGNGTFLTPKTYAVGKDVRAIAAADLNGDKVLDLVTSNFETSDVSVLAGKGDGTFDQELVFRVGTSPEGVAIGDINGDGKADIVTPNDGSDNISRLLNQTTLISLKSPMVDGSAEKNVSMNADLTTGTLVINSTPAITTNIVGYDSVIGTQADDILSGSGAANRIDGQGGNDLITGLGGDDILTGGEGRDRLFGGKGDDKITGGAGRDKLKGEEGKDRFIFDIGKPFDESIGVDRIMDFKRGEDKIVLDKTTFTRVGRRLFDNRVSFSSVNNVRQAEKSSSLVTYVRSTGSLYYNENVGGDGFGSGGLFATIRKPGSINGNLGASDFTIQA
jgi:Ca2+-binding RTX toxin-like protein